MKDVFKSKVDFWLVSFITAIVLISTVPVLIFAFSWLVLMITLVLLAFVYYLLFSIKYVIVDEILWIKCSFIINDKIDIMSIKKIIPTRTVLSAPAASLDRIAIFINNQKSPIIISPKNKEMFMRKLKSINSSISIEISES